MCWPMGRSAWWACLGGSSPTHGLCPDTRASRSAPRRPADPGQPTAGRGLPRASIQTCPPPPRTHPPVIQGLICTCPPGLSGLPDPGGAPLLPEWAWQPGPRLPRPHCPPPAEVTSQTPRDPALGPWGACSQVPPYLTPTECKRPDARSSSDL